MALFQILRGKAAKLSSKAFKDGYAYFTPDDGAFYIDAEVDGVQKRIRINPVQAVPEPSQSMPKPPTTSTTCGTVGTSTRYAREDHQHPKQPIKEAGIEWGGGSLNGNVTPIDAAMLPIIGYNKTDCAKPEGITVEYSNDAGATWIDYGVSDVTKSNLVSMCGNSSVYIGGGTSLVQKTLDDQVRITVNATKCGTYTALKKILLEISSNGAQKVKVLIEKAKGTAPEEFTEVGTYDITGWSGWNSIDIGQVYFGGGTEQNMWVLRFTFSIGVLNTTSYTSALQVLHILFLGSTNWNTPSAMARTGHLYTYDVKQNATFPSGLTARFLSGNGSSISASFVQASKRENILSDERLDKSLGKIMKWFADMKSLAFKDKVDKTDLSDAVQASLGKADSALQSYTETDPTVPAWAKAETKPSYTAAEVGADASGSSKQALDDAKAYTDTKIAAIPTPDVSGQIGEHNTSTSAHNDIRELITGLTSRLNALADSDDTTLDQLSEIVAYIKSNRSLIEEVTTNKVNVADIIDNLTTNVANKPLSAAQGVALKALIDAIPDWAKADTKPTYTAAEVGADASGAAAKALDDAKTYTDAAVQNIAVGNVIETNKQQPQKFWRGTKEEFDAVTAKDANTMYIVTDENGAVGGGVTPYQVAAANGYAGTEDDFNALLADLPNAFTSVVTALRSTTTYRDIVNAMENGSAVIFTFGGVVYNLASIDEESKIARFSAIRDVGKIRSWIAQEGPDGTTAWTNEGDMQMAPSAHAASHAADGDDPITPAAIGAATIEQVNTAIQAAIGGAIDGSY